MAELGSFRFRPRFRALPFVVFAIGAALLLAAFLGLDGGSRTFALVAGAAGVLLALLYRASPAWRLRAVVTEEALLVKRGDVVRLELPWSEVAELILSVHTKTCYVNGGSPERSFLVPGPGAPGPYRIEDREKLFDLIVARVPESRHREVPSLDATVPR